MYLCLSIERHVLFKIHVKKVTYADHFVVHHFRRHRQHLVCQMFIHRVRHRVVIVRRLRHHRICHHHHRNGLIKVNSLFRFLVQSVYQTNLSDIIIFIYFKHNQKQKKANKPLSLKIYSLSLSLLTNKIYLYLFFFSQFRIPSVFFLLSFFALCLNHLRYLCQLSI